MPIVCQRCRRTLEYSKDPPLFCSYCGQRLSATADVPTGTFQPTNNDQAQVNTPSDGAWKQLGPPQVVPERVGRYRILRQLGAGGMGAVYEAEAEDSKQKVAVKLLSPQLATNPISVERFRQEGRLASLISHPHCVFVMAADTENDVPYIVMELMPGTTLKDRVDQSGPMPAQEAIACILDVIDGLQEAHRLGVIHRDVKPSNCFLMPDGRVKIGDFGLSKSLQAHANLTQTGSFLGTVLFASPEQIRGEPVDFVSDVYSVCATLYYLLTGQAPFQHESVTAAMAKAISEDAIPPRQLKGDIPRALERIVLRGLERDRSRRWQSLAELQAALLALVPSQLSLSGLSIRAAAYLLDELIVRAILILPLSLGLSAYGYTETILSYSALVIFPIYFVLLEGLTGASLGKRLLRLRVCTAHSTEPPGLLKATIRTAVFYVLIIVTLMQPRQILERIDRDGLGPHILTASLPFVIGLGLLLLPMRRRNDYRGLHELLSFTCTRQLPRPPMPLSLHSRKPDRLASLPPRGEEVPAVIGGYRILNASPIASDGTQVLVGEDPALGRRLLIWLRPDRPECQKLIDLDKRLSVSRATRLRLLDSGTLNLPYGTFRWSAFVAPPGAPLVDVVDAHYRLPWPAVRPMLEQLTQELIVADQERTLPACLHLDQVWVDREGRVRLLDFPISEVSDTDSTKDRRLDLLREVAVTALEGQPRPPLPQPHLERIHAPIPLHAQELLRPLLTGTCKDLAEFQTHLQATRYEPAQVTSSVRLLQMAVQGCLLSIGLLMMFVPSALFGVISVLAHEDYAKDIELVLNAWCDPEIAQRWRQEYPQFAEKLSDPTFLQQMIETQLRDQAKVAELEQSLNGLDRLLLREIRRANEISEPVQRGVEAVNYGTRPIDERLNSAMYHVLRPDWKDVDSLASFLAQFPSSDWKSMVLLIVFWPMLWGVLAYLLQGSVSFRIFGIALVHQTDGRLASRGRCALRMLLLWGPVALLLCGSVYLQANEPGLMSMQPVLWWLALAIVPLYALACFLSPERAPLDRLLGICLVPD